MKKLSSSLYKEFEKSKMSDYSKVYGGLLYTHHSDINSYDTKETDHGPETQTSQADDSPVGASFN